MAAGRKDRDALGWFADELRAHRTTHGWTQADVAAKTSYIESLIAQVETCRKAATPELARALDRVFATRASRRAHRTCRGSRHFRAAGGQAPEPAVSGVVQVVRAA